MSTAAAPRLVPVSEYLENPVYEQMEYVDGVVLERNLGTGPHARIELNCGSELRAYLKAKPIGAAFTNLRCRLRIRKRTFFYLPDVAVVAGQGPHDYTYLDRAPDLAVEVRSPGDSIPSILRKAADYLAAGSRMVWIIVPEESCVLVVEKNKTTQAFGKGESLSGGDVLPGLSVSVDELFQ